MPPVFEFKCWDGCGHETAVFSHMDTAPRGYTCPECGLTMTRLYRPPRVTCMKPYVTSEITGEPIEIRTPRQEEAVCKEHGVARLMSTDSTKPRKPPRVEREPLKETYERMANAVKYNEVPT